MWRVTRRSKATKTLLAADSSSTKRRRHWKWPAASVLAAVLIGLACGLCESSTKQACISMTAVIASSLSLIGIETNAAFQTLPPATTYRTTTHSIKNISNHSLNVSENISRKKYDTSTAENTATKISDRITMRVCSTVPSTTWSSTNRNRALPPTHHQQWKSSGHTASLLSANLTST